jgi:class 3 adenylate cyclase
MTGQDDRRRPPAATAPSVNGPTLTGSQIQAINRFPDQNPNPVLRIDAGGRLLYANPASAPIVEGWSVTVGDEVPAAALEPLLAAVDSGHPVESRFGDRTFALLTVGIRDLGFINVYGTDVTVARAVDRLPDLNPNPVLRLAEDGRILYGNPASRRLLGDLGWQIGDALPERIRTAIFERLDRGSTTPLDVESGGRTFTITPVRSVELGQINVYATDVTAHKAIVKFPDQNPHPVFRIDGDGTLLYANAASTSLIAGLGCSLGQTLEPALLEPLLAASRGGGGTTVEIRSRDRWYALLAVDVPEFGFINVYGTDITAARELERLHRENERLLLNILPEAIADRLRAGEKLIADRFDDVTLLFADIVEFTRMSSGMAPDELVTVLNELFTVFDRLVDEYDLEKVKTIGDAYMVVGGLPEQTNDHTERMARMALDLVERIAALDERSHQKVRFRIGLHCGPVVAGVIGTKKFIYDVWGDTVNVASRMESHGVPGRIQVTGAVEQRLRDRFILEPRGMVDVKGKGPMPTWFLTGRRPARTRARAKARLPEARTIGG